MHKLKSFLRRINWRHVFASFALTGVLAVFCWLSLSLPRFALFWAFGLVFGFVLQRSRFCFVSAISNCFLSRDTRLLEGILPVFRSGDRFWQITVPLSLLDFGKSGEDSALLVQNMLRKVFARFDALSKEPVYLALEQIAVRSEHSLARGEDQFDTFHTVQGNFYRTPTESRSDWSFQIRGISGLAWEEREQLSFTHCLRDTFEISFQSGCREGRQFIPCDLAAVFYSPFRHFSGGVFQGKFSISTRGGRAESRTIRMENAVFRNMLLAPLVGPYTTFAVEGTVTNLFLSQAIFGTENIFAEGHLQVTNGAVEMPLFARCVGNFQLTVITRDRFGERSGCILDSTMLTIPFDRCAVHFRLHPGGIDFWADQRWENLLMYRRHDNSPHAAMTVYLPPHRRTVTYHEVMSLFAPDNAPVVPLTQGMRAIVPHLPILPR